MMAVMPVTLTREKVPRAPTGIGIRAIRTSVVSIVIDPRSVVSSRLRVDPTLVDRCRLVVVMLDDALFNDAGRRRPLDHRFPLINRPI